MGYAMKQVTAGLLALALVSAAACGPKDAAKGAAQDNGTASATSGASTELADVQNYTLSMDKVKQLFQAQTGLVRKAQAMSEEERNALQLPDGASLDDMVRQISDNPGFTAVVHDAGLEPREFVLASMSLTQSMMAAGVLEMRPNDNQDSLVNAMNANKDNVQFVRDHQAELNAMRDAMRKEFGGATTE
jgi:hypothetical protein